MPEIKKGSITDRGKVEKIVYLTFDGNVEALATAFADSKERRGCSYWQGLNVGFKGGFAASLPQSSTGGLPKLDQPILDEDDVKGIIESESSTEEEKDLWNEVGAFILRSVDFEFTSGRMNELLSTYKISKR